MEISVKLEIHNSKNSQLAKPRREDHRRKEIRNYVILLDYQKSTLNIVYFQSNGTERRNILFVEK